MYKMRLLFILMLSISVLGFSQDTRGLKLLIKDKSGKANEIKVYDRMFGLVVGINEFADPEVKRLNNCVNDAKGVKDILDKQYSFEKIEELYDKNATANGILAKLGQMQSQYKITGNDALFVFIASHGVTFNDIGYIVPHDGTFNETEQYKNISMTDLKEKIGEGIIKAKHIFYTIDACYSGSILTRGGGIEKAKDDELAFLQEQTKERVRYALTAGDKGQEVLDGGKNGHSVFTGRFIEALEEADGFITSGSLSQKISMRVFSNAKDRGHTQNPQFGKLSGMGDFVFLKKSGNNLAKVESELALIEKEMAELKIKQEQSKNQKEKDLAALELQKKQADAEKKRLEQEALKELEAKKEAEKKRQTEIQAEYELNQKKQEEEFAKVQKANEEMRKLLEEMKSDTGNIEITINGILETEKAIKETKSNFETARINAVNQIKAFYKDKYSQVNAMKKDMFELNEEFEFRKNGELQTYQRNEFDELSQINKKYDNEIVNSTKDMGKHLEELKKSVFTMKGGDVKVNFGDYNEEGQFFPGTVSCSSKYLTISEQFKIDITSGSAKERKEKGMRVLNAIKSNGYIGEIEYELKYETKSKTWSALYRQLKVTDITDNSLVMEKASEEYKKIVEEKRKERFDKEFVFVQGGSFKSTKSNSNIFISVGVSDFWIGKCEVTQKEWVEVMGSNPSYFKGDNLPVEQVSWYDCIEYCNKKSIKDGLTPVYTIDKSNKDLSNTNSSDNIKWTVTSNRSANGYRLPTVAEWVYAATGGQKSENYTYSGSKFVGEVAVYYGNSNKSTKSVRSKRNNELGIYDMSGNVWEWCWGWDCLYNYSNSGVCGGSWNTDAGDCKSSSSYSKSADLRDCDLGLRVVRGN